MPICDGMTACKRIREHEAKTEPDLLSHTLGGRIPIVAVSASLLEKQLDELLDVGSTWSALPFAPLKHH
jgi:CheY-like chemotaxis protein